MLIIRIICNRTLLLLVTKLLGKSRLHCSGSMFVDDDVTLYATGNNVSHIQSTLQADLDCVLIWFRKNRLFVNPSKSSCLLVGTPKRTCQLCQETNIYYEPPYYCTTKYRYIFIFG